MIHNYTFRNPNSYLMHARPANNKTYNGRPVRYIRKEYRNGRVNYIYDEPKAKSYRDVPANNYKKNSNIGSSGKSSSGFQKSNGDLVNYSGKSAAVNSSASIETVKDENIQTVRQGRSFIQRVLEGLGKFAGKVSKLAQAAWKTVKTVGSHIIDLGREFVEGAVGKIRGLFGQKKTESNGVGHFTFDPETGESVYVNSDGTVQRTQSKKAEKQSDSGNSGVYIPDWDPYGPKPDNVSKEAWDEFVYRSTGKHVEEPKKQVNIPEYDLNGPKPDNVSDEYWNELRYNSKTNNYPEQPSSTKSEQKAKDEEYFREVAAWRSNPANANKPDPYGPRPSNYSYEEWDDYVLKETGKPLEDQLGHFVPVTGVSLNTNMFSSRSSSKQSSTNSSTPKSEQKAKDEEYFREVAAWRSNPANSNKPDPYGPRPSDYSYEEWDDYVLKETGKPLEDQLGHFVPVTGVSLSEDYKKKK